MLSCFLKKDWGEEKVSKEGYNKVGDRKMMDRKNRGGRFLSAW